MSTLISLDYPITDGNGVAITEINLRRAKVKDIRKMQEKKGEGEQEIELMHRLTGLIPEDLDNLDIADYGKLQEAIKAMMVGNSTS